MPNPNLEESSITGSFDLATQIQPRTCVICGRVLPRKDVVRASSVRPQLAQHLANHHPGKWSGEGHVCRRCLNHARIGYVLERLEQERGELSKVEHEVAQKAGQHLTIAQNIDEQFRRTVTRSQRAADAVARVGGSWSFVIVFGVVLAAWMALNSRLGASAFDPFPFILLNLVLSCLAAIQAPIIMMAQNRAAARDRMQADEDYRTNLKAELEIASLHDKVDHLLHSQFERMAELQEIQIDLLTDLAEALRHR
ncbi:MAG: DUF1003 domain-containing protein [bacterium]